MRDNFELRLVAAVMAVVLVFLLSCFGMMWALDRAYGQAPPYIPPVLPVANTPCAEIDTQEETDALNMVGVTLRSDSPYIAQATDGSELGYRWATLVRANWSTRSGNGTQAPADLTYILQCAEWLRADREQPTPTPVPSPSLSPTPTPTPTPVPSPTPCKRLPNGKCRKH